MGAGVTTINHGPVGSPSFDFSMSRVDASPAFVHTSNPRSGTAPGSGIGSGPSPGSHAITHSSSSSSQGQGQIKHPTTSSYPPDLVTPPLTNAQMSAILWCVHTAHELAFGSSGGGSLDGTAFSVPLPRTDKGSNQGQGQSQSQGSNQVSNPVPQLPLFDGSGGAEASQGYLTSFHRSLLLLGTPPVDINTVMGQVGRYTLALFISTHLYLGPFISH